LSVDRTAVGADGAPPWFSADLVTDSARAALMAAQALAERRL